MESIFPHLREEYNRWAQKLGSALDLPPDSLVRVRQVLRAHYLICDFFLMEGEKVALTGPRSLDMLVSAVSRPALRFDDQMRWKRPEERIATLFYGLVKNHPFHDGNKRTALVIALSHAHLEGRVPTAIQSEFEKITVLTAANGLDTLQEFSHFSRQQCSVHDQRVLYLAKWFRQNTRKTDARYYVVTYRDLASLLERFQFRLVNPSNNKIDLVRVTTEKRLLTRKTVEAEKFVGQIGYPGPTKQVNQKAIATVRRLTGLVSKHGFDSEVFFKGADPTATLIDKYQKILRRLKDQ